MGPTRRIQAAMVAAVTAIFALAYLDLRREQARALDDFTAEQATLAQALAGTVGARIDGVLADLDALLALDEPAPLAHQLLQNAALYRAVEVTADADDLVTRTPALAAARAALLAAARDGGEPLVSAPLRLADGDSGRLRLFVARRGGRAAVLLVDSDGFFRGTRPAAPAPTRWLVVDAERRWLEIGPRSADAAGASTTLDWSAAPAPSPEVAALLSRMGTGDAGTMTLSRPAAAALGLERRMAVAAWAPVPLKRSRPWAVGAVVSAMRVRDRAQLAAWRLGAATGLTALLVSLFGLALARQQRRAQELAAALGLAEATSALRERSEKLVEAIPLGVLALDGERRVTAVNPYLAARGVVAPAPLAEALPHASADEKAELSALIDEALATRRPVQRADLRLRLGGAALRDIDAYAVPLGRPLAGVDCFLVLHDRTETRTLERNLQRAEKLATIGTLAAGVAHEVGTPLGIISGRAEQLMGKLPDGGGNEAARKAVTSILAQVDKVSTTIRQLLDFARVRPIEATVVTPAQLLGQAAALLEHRFRHARVALAVEAPASIAAVAADPGQLEQVLVNLLMNACDACTVGGHVTARARQLDGRVLIEVIDDGAGIAPEHLSSVLDPFFTTKKRGQGTGLGLTIAADIVKNHGGTLEIDSTVGSGTTVRVGLPMADKTDGIRA